MEEEAIVMYPSPAIGHLISMVELAKVILLHQPSLSIHILIATFPYNSGSVEPYIHSVSSTIPSIKFHHLPVITLPPSITSSSSNHEDLAFETLRLLTPHLHHTLSSISISYRVTALIIDFFSTSAHSVSSQLNIPCYYFFTSGAAVLAVFLHLPSLHRTTHISFKHLHSLLHIPGVPPLPSSDMAEPILDRNYRSYHHFIEFASNMPDSAGIIVNTFELLEPRALKAIRDGLCVPHKPTPPIYCVGPLIAAEVRRNHSGKPVEDCLAWLDKQPTRTVVFLCFGSLGLFTKEQLREIAVGLERSRQRFLWVVRNPPTNSNQSLATTALPDPDLDSLLPDGFLERTKETGLVVKSWAPQAAVLSHGSVGGFVTHCGWNSVLEALCGGVPMVAWPLYAEQRTNRVLMVEEMKIALPMNESESGFVSASEVEKRVKELMESETGNSVREKTIAMQNAAKDAMSKGGSSLVALSKLFQSWKGK